MKIALKIILLFVSVNLYSQSAPSESITLSRSKLEKMNDSEEIVKATADCEKSSYEFVANVKGKLMTAVGDLSNLTKELRSLMKGASTGSIIHLQVKSKCAGKLNMKEYKVVMKE